MLTGCSYYFDTAPDRQLVQRVEERMHNKERLPEEQLSKPPRLSVDQALPKFRERRPQNGRSLPPAKPALNKIEGANVPPVPMAQPHEASKQLSSEPMRTQDMKSTLQVDQALPPAKPVQNKTEEPDSLAASKVPPEASKQLSIAEARKLALENNLDLKIAMVDPKIASTLVSQEEAKFDDLIFARAKYGNKNTPAQNLDVVTFTPSEASSPLLKGQVDKLTAVPQSTEILEMDAGVVIPLRTGAKVTLSMPFDEKSSLRGLRLINTKTRYAFPSVSPCCVMAGLIPMSQAFALPVTNSSPWMLRLAYSLFVCWPLSIAAIGGSISSGASWMCVANNMKTRRITWQW